VDARIISPEEYLGFAVGADRCLADWEQVVGYFRLAAEASPRIAFSVIGSSTEGRPLGVATITSPENHLHLEEFRQVQKLLADPRLLSNDEAALLLDSGKTVVLITCGIHATEVGAAQMSMQLAYELATGEDIETREILANTILLLVPSLNPDGLDLVVNWYRETLGTRFEGTAPPVLYHKYAGHDNNRDWFMFTQQETRLAVLHLHNHWHPQIVLDMHQQNADGPRMVLPPYIDPYDPNVDPLIRQNAAWLGQAIAAELTGRGKTGVMTNVIYDAYSPNRAYQHYHGGVRILAEVASVRLATPIALDFGDLQAGRGQDPKIATWNHPAVWQGGEWRLRDIVEYSKICAWACLQHAAKFRQQWLRNFYAVGCKAVAAKESPYAYLVPREQRDAQVAREMLEILMFAGVELHEAGQAFVADGIDYAAGTRVVLMQQPYGCFAKTMLEKQTYPDLRLYPGGPPRRPYDSTAHSLPMQMGVVAVEVRAAFVAELTKVTHLSPFVRSGRPKPKMKWLYIRPEANRSFTAITQIIKAGYRVYRLFYELDSPRLPPGTFVVSSTAHRLAVNLSEKYGLEIGYLEHLDLEGAELLKIPRIGVYKSHVPNPDEGWLRFVLLEYEFCFDILDDAAIRHGALGEHYDAIILPSALTKVFSEGHAQGTYPAPYTGGLGTLGAKALYLFVEGGGTVVAVDGACEWVVRELALPVRNVVANLPESEFYAPGSFLRVALDTHHPLGYGMPREAIVVSNHSPAFAVDNGGKIIGRYPVGSPLAAGWLLGGEKLQGRAALVECSLGLGRIILCGFRPYFRAQARGTYKVLFNALLHSVLER